MFENLLKVVGGATVGAFIASACFAGDANLFVTKSSQSERYVPTIWVDPDGCEHWAMDDGAEGYMTPHVTRDGIPVGQMLNIT